MERDPSNADLPLRVLETQEALLSFCASQVKWADFVIQSRWLVEGDQGTKLFYKSFKSLAAAKDIPELFNLDGMLETTWEGMAHPVTKHFTSILGRHPSGPPHLCDLALIEEVLQSQSDRLLDSKKASMNSPFTLEEWGDTIQSMANNKCPGPDGTPIEFFKLPG